MTVEVSVTPDLEETPNFSEKTELFTRIAQTVFTQPYQLSLVFIDDTTSQTLNKQYRGKDKPTNVLAFPINEQEGEIFINVEQAAREVGAFNTTQEKHIIYLFIHGLLHLKGYDHGDTMDTREKELLQQFFPSKETGN